MTAFAARRWTTALAVVLNIFLAACGGGGDGGGGGITQPPQVPVLTLIEVEGNFRLDQGTSARFTAWCSYNIGPKKDCTKTVNWQSSQPTVVTVVLGDVFAQRGGTSELRVTLADKETSVVVQVVPSPWAANWAMLTPEERAFLIGTNLGAEGYTKRWNKAVITVWAGPGIVVKDLHKAFAFWADSVVVGRKGVVAFSIVPDSASADITFSVDPMLDADGKKGICGEGGPSEVSSGGVITKAFVRIVGRPECSQNWDFLSLIYAHELGHDLGMGIARQASAHTPGGDVMSYPMVFRSSKLLSAVFGLVYTVPSGTPEM